MIKNGFFNSVDDDRLYNADDLSTFFYNLFTDGVLALPEDALKVTAADGLKVKVAPGFAMIFAKYFMNTADLIVPMPAAHDTYPRIDRVVIRLDRQQRNMVLAVLIGTPAATPVVPALTRNSNIYELSLAKVGIRANAAAVTGGDIVDERKNEEVCGFVKARFAVNGDNTIKPDVVFDIATPVFVGVGGEPILGVAEQQGG